MNDPAAEIFRYLMLAFVPAMLLFPLVFVLFVPTKADDAEAQEKARTRQLALFVMTFLAIATWGALALIANQTRIPLFDHLARMSWLLFFPLWFGLAMPTVLAKNAAWGVGLDCSRTNDSPIRTASLAPRTRENPIRTWHWVLMVLVSVGFFAALAARGAYSFGPEGPAAAAARFRWIIATAVSGFCALCTLVIIPFSIDRMQTEPEPLDPAGSPELVTMYSTERRKRILGLFWLLAIVQPAVIGVIFCSMVWLNGVSGRTIGLAGAFAGTATGFAGAAFGIVSAVRRTRIAEAKARLEAAAASPYASKSGNR